MAIIKWDPYRDIVTLRDRMNRLFEDMPTLRGEEKDLAASAWAPAVDIYETENEVVLTAEIPGVDEKDIEIKVEDDTLTIRGERKFEKETKEENFHRIERAYGSFFRSFALPSYVDHDEIEAEHENGVLRIRMPKKAELKPRKVKIVKPAAPPDKPKK
ncbi:MAG TPA: Hsp20/alpha crystallin family protein [Terriglobales bacterium]|nr:Hsp20/alpha crystallin family protein [Terriglobales bacterium]